MESLIKADIRRLAFSRRLSIGADERNEISHRIAARVLDLPELAAARCVHVYSAMPERGEVDTAALISRLSGLGKRIVLPVVRTFESGAHGLVHHEWDGRSPLTRNRWGIREPLEGHAVPPEEIDAVIVPMLAADMHGNRIGYGKGFYDAFLATVSAPSIGLLAEACLFQSLPSEPHDMPMTILVTEERVLRPERASRNTERAKS